MAGLDPAIHELKRAAERPPLVIPIYNLGSEEYAITIEGWFLKMPSIKSSMISWAEYDEAKRELEITFKNGSVHAYFKVPKGVYDQFLRAPSQGKFFNANIKETYHTGPKR